MWEKILKVQVLGTKQRVKQGIKPLPKEEKSDCRERLLDLMEKVQLKQDLKGQAQGMMFVSNFIGETVTEKECCEILKFIEDFFNHSYYGRYSGKMSSGGNKMEMNMWTQKSLLNIEFTFRIKAFNGFNMVVIRTTDTSKNSMTIYETKEAMNWTKF
jgi:hypothetical protein